MKMMKLGLVVMGSPLGLGGKRRGGSVLERGGW